MLGLLPFRQTHSVVYRKRDSQMNRNINAPGRDIHRIQISISLTSVNMARPTCLFSSPPEKEIKTLFSLTQFSPLIYQHKFNL